MLNPLWLNTFCTLVDVGHFTHTAEKLFMTQPGVSQHIKKLELACGYDLLKREGKSVELTEQGHLVYNYAHQQQRDAANLIEALSFDDPYKGLCKFACSGALALALSLYPEFINLQKNHPDLITHMEVAPNNKILDEIQRGQIDLGIVTHNPTPSLFRSEELTEEPLCLVLPKSDQNTLITLDILMSRGLIKHPDAEHYLSLYFDHCKDEALEKGNANGFPIASYINQLSQILLPIAQGIGFTVLPQSAIDAFPDKDKLYIHTPTELVMERLFLVQKRNRELPKRYQTLIKKIKEILI
ncbi:LysR family transcriptional regulator [Aliivibrio finisterrensis]|uniref:LysR family transcriptional regulator n=1 Tax=Aliivibrio finisterrensis TaxID=511998 RepID=UPI00101FD0DC|nr:LysR family transcriptional regulator [Aliivibrio finisterrensis]RYU68248.1 LysR family transcriptional regulator [Aliivibrio finisterrensis]RYU71948.1 LysR family transcriptional regulator [Aliivibrio finisterrensis]RYU75557.1 LysR family transcriptional regulator [Aliivibrio finisterrensis]